MNGKSDVARSDVAKDALGETADGALDNRLPRSATVARLRLQYAFLAVCEAAWAQPMRGLVVCGRLLERVERKIVAHPDKLVALKVRLAFLRVRKFFFKSAFFFAELRYRAFRRRQIVYELSALIGLRRTLGGLVRKFAKQVGNGRLEFDRLAECKEALRYLDCCLADFYGRRGSSCNFSGCHGENYTKNEEAV